MKAWRVWPLPHLPSHCVGRKQDGALLGWTRSRYLVIPRDKEMVRMGGTARSHKPFPREPGRLHLISIAPHPNPHSAHRPECGPRAAAAPPCTAGQVNQLLPETRKHTKPQHPPPPVGFLLGLSVCTSHSAPLPHLPSATCDYRLLRSVAPDKNSSATWSLKNTAWNLATDNRKGG